MPRAWLLILSACCAVSLLVEFAHPFVARAPASRATIETCMTLLALASAFLLRDQVIRTRRAQSLLLITGLTVLTITEFCANALPAAIHLSSAHILEAPLPIGQLCASALFAAAASTSPNRVVRGRNHPLTAVAVLTLAIIGLSALAGLKLPDELGGPTSVDLRSGSNVHPLGLVVLLATVALFVFAAVEFERRARAERSNALALLAGVSLLFGVARLYHLAMPAVTEQSVTPREVVRLLAFGLVFAAALLMDFERRSRMTRLAAITERRKVAWDLHDGLAQDLALIAAHGAHMSQELGADHPVVLAAQRALALSRGIIGELSADGCTSTREALEAAANEMCDRFSISVTVDVQLNHELPAHARTNVVRIVREAIANAAQHGGAKRVSVTLRPAGEGVALRVCDNGCGLGGASANTRGGGVGMHSMRSRAQALGGTIAARARPHGGTEVEVLFP